MTGPVAGLPDPYRGLAGRIGEDLLRRRLLAQAGHWARLHHQGEGLFKIEKILPVDQLLQLGLRLSGLGGRARTNFLDVRVVEQHWHLPALPEGLDGFRLLQLTDLHLDLDPALTPVLQERISSTPHDAAVVTGDYRDSTDEDPGPCLAGMRRLIPCLSPRRFGILGNHDFIEMAAPLEEAGLPILLNEHAWIDGTGNGLAVAGVDDPHFYKTHDFSRAHGGLPDGACTILLCHTPEAAEEAAAFPSSLMLCGHTHGGQICLPGGIPLVCPVRKSMPRDRIRGAWRCGHLQGYASPGTGSCGVAARFHCPPEITVHILHPAKKFGFVS